jgi:hypothetical protein
MSIQFIAHNTNNSVTLHHTHKKRRVHTFLGLSCTAVLKLSIDPPPPRMDLYTNLLLVCGPFLCTIAETTNSCVIYAHTSYLACGTHFFLHHRKSRGKRTIGKKRKSGSVAPPKRGGIPAVTFIMYKA